MILELLKKRSSVRNFSDEQVPQKVIDYILDAGRLSPSGGNEQPWKFGVINDINLINKISEISYNQQWIKSANFLIILCAKIVPASQGGRDIQKARFPEIKDEIEKMDQTIYASLNQEEHQSKIPGTHMVLAALEHEVGSCWISRFRVRELANLLNLSKQYIPSEMIAFGYPEDKKRPLKKKSIIEVVFSNNHFRD